MQDPITPSNVNWEIVEAAYIHSDMSSRNLAEEFGVSLSQVEWRCSQGQWVAKRQQVKKRQAQIIGKRLEKESLAAHAEAVDMLNRAKSLVATKLVSRLENDDYQPTPADLVMLQKLESTLRNPKWDKVEQGPSVVNNTVVIEGVLADERKRREGVVFNVPAERVTAGDHLAPDMAGFLASEDTNGLEPERGQQAGDGSPSSGEDRAPGQTDSSAGHQSFDYRDPTDRDE